MTNVPAAHGGASSDAVDQAVHWAVRLESGMATDQERNACAAWRAVSPHHELAWQQVQAIEQTFRGVSPANGHLAFDALQKAAPLQARRRRALQLLGLGAIGTMLGGLALRFAPWQQRAEYATAVGERRLITLEDGTALQLNTGSEAQVVFSPLRRLIVLRRGEIFIRTGADSGSLTGRRPFWVETAEARLEAIGTRFGVRQGAGETRLDVTEGRVAVHVGSAPVLVAQAGDRFVLRASAPMPVRVLDRSFDPGAWTDGVLVAKQMRLGAFIAELARYRSAPLHCDAGAAALQVSGVFQLDGPDPVGRALDVLVRTLPVRVEAASGGGASTVVRI